MGKDPELKYLMPNEDGIGFRLKADSDTCMNFDAFSLDSATPEIQAARPRSAPCTPTWQSLSADEPPVSLAFGAAVAPGVIAVSAESKDAEILPGSNGPL